MITDGSVARPGATFIGTNAGSVAGGLISIKRQPLTDHVGIDAVTDGNAGNGYARLQAFLNNLGLERLGVSVSLAHLRAIASA